eukprot:TRINITY_DN457_c0_g1_i3.p2 TRINITY_DN457_c0_g1~~TRINITY_DN457_c0_g1_i3.p2  ORF type:complete len:204 (+),score=60.95 TRINITY_DN457_c0_g1_i3:59-670(+)
MQMLRVAACALMVCSAVAQHDHHNHGAPSPAATPPPSTSEGGEAGHAGHAAHAGHDAHAGHAAHAGHDAHAGHSMQMFFVSSTTATFLFEKWVTNDRGMYALAIILTGGFCALAPLLRYQVTASKGRFPLALRTVLTFVYFNVTYAAMLLAMTFNTGVWWAVMVGTTIGFGVTEYVQELSEAQTLTEEEEATAKKLGTEPHAA